MSDQNVLNFVRHTHHACGHCYDGSEPLEIQLASEYSCQNAWGDLELHVLHPRWCPNCLVERSEALKAVYEKVIAYHIKTHGSSKKALKQRSYLRGVCAGRIRALSRPLKEGADLKIQKEIGDAMEAMDLSTDIPDEEMSSLAGALKGYGVVESGDVSGMKDLIERLQAHGLECNEVGDAVERHEKHYKLGVIDGKVSQAEAEYKALLETDRERGKLLLSRALL